MAWIATDNIKGPRGEKGPAGTVSSVSAATLPPGSPAEATLTGTEDVHMHLGIPQGERGPQGPPGVASSASAESVPAEEQAAVIMSQEGELVHVHFKVPRGAPGVNAIPTAEAIGANLAAPDSLARPGFADGIAQVVQDPSSAVAIHLAQQQATGLAGKADLVGGRVPATQVGKSQTATNDTVPVRGTSGQLPGIGDPLVATDAANRRYVDTKHATLAGDIELLEAQTALTQDLIATGTVSATWTGAFELAATQWYPLLVAPQDMEIVGVSLVFANAIDLFGSTNVMTARVFHRLRASDAAVNVVQKTSQQEALTSADRAKPWDMSAGTWGAAADRIVPAGRVLSLLFSFTGTAKILFPVTVTIQWRPVR
ncbi:hypothetical protein MUN78_04385 [Leucobacter allii]|uniref:Minor tail protein n=1 Tax=Leucobacter allii TaxID=2932247 RepID=A0ABY4FPF9_9MICO|nr:hypothetical protein [Leucobacter allii]UOQ58089.1 hypothetical protein MUN78_04385 [Leucobacter allii]